MSDRPSLPREVVLLALHPGKGTFPWSRTHLLSVAGAVLAQLFLDGGLRLEGEGRRARVAVASGAPSLGDPVLDGVVRQVREERPRPLRTWGGRLARDGSVRHAVARELCRSGVLRASRRPVLLVFSRPCYLPLERGPGEAARARLREAVAGDGPLPCRDGLMAGLACVGGVHRVALEREALKGRRKRGVALAAGKPVSPAGETEAAALAALEWARVAAAAAAAAGAA